MRKVFAIVIFILLFFSQLGYFFIYAVIRDKQDETLETNVFSSIKEKECIAINYTDNFRQIRWQEDDEIIFNGQEYDVAKMKTIGGKTYLFCITENKENELLADMTLSYASDHTTDVDSQLVFSDECILASDSNQIIPFKHINRTAIFQQSAIESESEILIRPPRQFSV